MGNIFDICSENYLKILLNQSLLNNLSVGLAGKLNLSNIPQLAELQPKIVGLGLQSVWMKIEKRNSQ